MAAEIRWTRQRVECREAKGEFNLLVGWRRCGEKEELHGVMCDNPKLAGIDNWDCRWSCWKGISRAGA